MSEYLWDRRGTRDAEIADLERALSPLRFTGPLDTRSLGLRPRAVQPYAAIAASIVLGALAWQLQPGPLHHDTVWTATGNAGQSVRLHTGQPLKTGDGTRIRLEAEDVGQVELAPNSELRISESRTGRQRLTLQQGRIHALIWAPPRQFVVDTPSARAVDLGCQYDLAVDAAGNGFLTVETGWVAFQFRRHESFIPAGAACRTWRATGPGIPYFQDAAKGFVDSLEQYETTHSPAALKRVLAGARAKDGLTLWHLLGRVPETERGAVFERFAQLVPLPKDVSARGATGGDPRMLDLCWNALNLDDAEWWREWKREWRP